MKKNAPRKRQKAPGTKKKYNPARMTAFDLKPVLDEIVNLLRGVMVLLEQIAHPLLTTVKVGQIDWMTPPVEEFHYVAIDENGEPELLVP